MILQFLLRHVQRYTENVLLQILKEAANMVLSQTILHWVTSPITSLNLLPHQLDIKTNAVYCLPRNFSIHHQLVKNFIVIVTEVPNFVVITTRSFAINSP